MFRLQGREYSIPEDMDVDKQFSGAVPTVFTGATPTMEVLLISIGTGLVTTGTTSLSVISKYSVKKQKSLP